MKNKFVLFIFMVTLFMFLFLISQVSLVTADGGYFPPPGYWVRSGQQKAIIFHEENTETLILTSGFQGNAKDLIWIIPTPTNPEITKANEEIFDNIAKLTRPEYDYSIGYGGIMEATTGVKRLDVVHIQSKKVDYYDVDVVLATNSDDLVWWFNANGYDYPEEYSYVLQHYINKGWFFTAVKVSPEAQGATEVIQDMKEGHPTPVKMVFLSDKIVFPLKISSVDFEPETEEEKAYYRYGRYIPIQLWIIADGKYEASHFDVQYGNWFDKDDVEDLGEDDNGEALIQPKRNKYYITSLYANYQKSQMDDDVYLRKADDDKKINAGPETYELFLRGLIIALILLISWVFTPIGIMFIVGSLLLFFSSNKTAGVIGWIIVVFAFFVTLVTGLVFFGFVLFNKALDNYVVFSVLATFFLLIIIMALLIKLQIRQRGK